MLYIITYVGYTYLLNFCIQLWEKAGEQGLLGVSIKEEHHGLGGDILHAAITWEEQ